MYTFLIRAKHIIQCVIVIVIHFIKNFIIQWKYIYVCHISINKDNVQGYFKFKNGKKKDYSILISFTSTSFFGGYVNVEVCLSFVCTIVKILVLKGLFYILALNDDPCKIAKSLPNFELRLKVYKIDGARDRPICDRYFISEPGEWFRTVDGNEMVNNKTSFWECGTQYSIYMEGRYFISMERLSKNIVDKALNQMMLRQFSNTT